MGAFDDFAEIVTKSEPLAPRTSLGIGGPAKWFAKPVSVEQLSRLLKRRQEEGIPFRLLGSGTNVLVPDEGFNGLVISLSDTAFRAIRIEGQSVEVGCGALLADLIDATSMRSLGGLEDLVGIPGTVGGALRNNAGDRTGDIGQHVTSIEILDPAGQAATYMRADIRFGYRQSNLDDVVIVSAKFELDQDSPEDIVRRIKKIWIGKKAAQPFGFQAAGYVFHNSRGLSASELIDRAGLRGMKVGGAEISVRDPQFIIAQAGTTSRDVSRLIELVRSRVEEQTGVLLDLQIDVW